MSKGRFGKAFMRDVDIIAHINFQHKPISIAGKIVQVKMMNRSSKARKLPIDVITDQMCWIKVSNLKLGARRTEAREFLGKAGQNWIDG